MPPKKKPNVFKAGDRVLCLFSDLLYYEARVMEAGVRHNDTDHFRVHYVVSFICKFLAYLGL